MRRLGRILGHVGRVLGALAILLAVMGTGLYFHLRGSLPSLSGNRTIVGLQDRVQIVRDANAVPHIFANSHEDAALALGYAHAQDRLWQMEFSRRIGAGRVSEMLPPLGPLKPLLDLDRSMRGLGVYRRAQDSVNALQPRTRRILEAYATGVNTYIRERQGSYGPEFTLLQVTPDPWTPADTLVIAKLFALSLDGNWRAELMRARAMLALGEEKTRQLFPQLDDARDATLSVINEALRSLPLDRLYDVTDHDATRKREASNEWVVAGARTRSGKPLLANDPHLGLAAPGTWYLARLVGQDFDIRGATMPGTPAILLGHNNRIAWGFTTTNLDSQDLFIEKIDPTNPNNYVTPEGSRAFAVREEIITVRFQDPVRLRVRETRHGPVISDVLDLKATAAAAPSGHVLALSATALDPADTSAEGFLEIGLATNWEQFLAATRKIVSPMQNIVFADIEGNIGFVSPARVPIRRRGDGSLPMPGWTGEYDWAGFVPFEELPRAFNPPSGVIVNANARVTPTTYRHFITKDWVEPYRQRRAAAMLAATQRHGMGSMIAMQEDNVSPETADTLPLMLAIEPRGFRQAAAIDMLRAWNRRMLADRPEPLIYSAWLRELHRALYADELGEDLYREVSGQSVAFLVKALRDNSAWCDDTRTRETETCADIIARSLDTALEQLVARFGTNMERWRWGDAHMAVHRHLLLDALPLVRNAASVRFPADGGPHTLNRAAYSARDPFNAVHGATLRAVYDFEDLDNSRFAIPLGQSGNLLSPWYRNFVDGWRRFEYVRIAGFRFAVINQGVGTLNLAPPAK